jgi:selenocysteine lyase/cysteine desulfurase
VRKIADAVKKKGCDVIVDGAHSFAHFDFKIPDLNCDYFATSLHKWLGAPFGSGMLYIKKDKIKNVWPLLSSPEPLSGDIRKFETLGTRSFASEMAIANAVDFHNMIGTKRKETRLRYLKNYWCNKVKTIPKVKIHTPADERFSCALAFVSIEGKTPEETESYLLDKKRIHFVSIHWEKLHGNRITPNVYTSLNDLDLLVEGIKELAT